jgi:hypothetical protein
VSLRRLRAGEWLALIGAIGLLATLFSDWFGLPPAARGNGDLAKSGWASLGWALDVLLVLAILGGLATALATALRQTPAWSVGSGVLTAPVGLIAFTALALRVVLFQPDLGVGLPNDLVDVRAAAYLGLAFCALIPVGAWTVLRDERTDAPESAYTPPPPRPVPGA